MTWNLTGLPVRDPLGRVICQHHEAVVITTWGEDTEERCVECWEIVEDD